MATRFYLPGSSADGTTAIAPAVSSVWDVTTGYGTRPCDIVKTNAAITTGARSKGSTTAWHDRLDTQFVSAQQLAAQTIAAGTISAVVRTVESVATADMFLQIVVRVVSADGLTDRGAIYAGSALTAVVTTAGAQNQEYPTTSATRIWSAVATSSVTAQAGDRLVIEIGTRGGGTASADTFNLRFGNPTASADFALTAGLTTDLCPWVELSQTLTWATSVTLPGDAATGTDSLAVAADVPLTDTGHGDGTLTVAASASLTDTATAADTFAVLVPAALADSGVGGSTFTVAAVTPLTDTAAGADSLTTTAAAPLADAGTSTATFTVAAATALTDSAAGSETFTVLGITRDITVRWSHGVSRSSAFAGSTRSSQFGPGTTRRTAFSDGATRGSGYTRAQTRTTTFTPKE